MRIFIASDTHIAKVWDRLDRTVPRVLNPNAMLRRLVSKVEKGDVLVLNGDLIDYQDAHYHGGRERNRTLLLEILERCRGDVLLNLGNHDYRKRAYNFAIYGLTHVNVPERARKRYKSAIGHHKFRWFGELGSIFGRHHRIRSGHPKTQYARRDGADLLLLDTGFDAHHRIMYFLHPKRWRYLWRDPSACIGLDQHQLAKVRGAAQENDRLRRAPGRPRPLFILVHTPPFFTTRRLKGVVAAPGFQDRLGQMYHARFLDGSYEFLETIAASDRNITVLSGHTHIPRQFLLDKRTRILRSCALGEINRRRDDSRYIKFITTPAVGGIDRPHNTKVGYVVYDPRTGFHGKTLQDFKRRRSPLLRAIEKGAKDIEREINRRVELWNRQQRRMRRRREQRRREDRKKRR
jgi:predicted phosphodiesterase